jgi:hypothetical protein
MEYGESGCKSEYMDGMVQNELSDAGHWQNWLLLL